MEFPVLQFVLVVPCALTGQHWKESGSIFFSSSIRHLSTSLLFSMLSSPTCLSLTFCDRCSNPLIILMALCYSVASTVKFKNQSIFSTMFLLFSYSRGWTKAVPIGTFCPSRHHLLFCLFLIMHSQLHSFDCIGLPGFRVTSEQGWKLFQLLKKVMEEWHFPPFILTAIRLHLCNIFERLNARELLS